MPLFLSIFSQPVLHFSFPSGAGGAGACPGECRRSIAGRYTCPTQRWENRFLTPAKTWAAKLAQGRFNHPNGFPSGCHYKMAYRGLTGAANGLAGELMRPQKSLDNSARWSLDICREKKRCSKHCRPLCRNNNSFPWCFFVFSVSNFELPDTF